MTYLSSRPFFAISSCVALGIAILALNLVGDAVQEAADPRLRSSGERA